MLELISRVYAQTCANGQVETDFGCVTSIPDYINNILTRIYPIVGALALLMIIYAGFLYMTSQGNPEKISLAKDIIIGVVIGIALIFLMGLMLRTIGVM